MSTSVALVPLSLSPVSAIIAAYNAEALARKQEGDILFLHVEDAAHWASYGIFLGEEYFAMLDAEYEKEVRKSWMDDNCYCGEDCEICNPTPDPMEGWYI